MRDGINDATQETEGTGPGNNNVIYCCCAIRSVGRVANKGTRVTKKKSSNNIPP